MNDDYYSLSMRANVLYKKARGGVYIYEDHRTILNVLFWKRETLENKAPFDIFMFDNHDDHACLQEYTMEKIHENHNTMTKEILNNIVEYDLSSLDDDWVTAGMEMGLIGNCFLFNARETDLPFKKEYQTKHYGTRYFYNIGDIWDELDHGGRLNGKPRKILLDLWEHIGWQENEYSMYEINTKSRNLVFDIDLDCFSCKIMDTRKAIPEDILLDKLSKPFNERTHRYNDSLEFIQHLLAGSTCRTICIESNYCGGIRESQKIFNMVDSLFFNYELGE